MSVISKINELRHVKNNIKQSIEDKNVNLDNIEFRDYASKIEEITGGGDNGGGSVPTGGSGFTGATIPLTYYNLANPKEKTLEYKSAHKITISGLEGRATITNNGTNNVTVEFDVSSQVSSLKNFTISLDNGTSFKGMHAHYGSNITSGRVLVLAYKHITPDGTEGTIGTNYIFIDSDTLPLFSSETTRWNDIYSYQLLNVLIGNWSGGIEINFLRFCYSFNQPLDLSNVTSIGHYFLRNATSFNQPLDISGITSIGDSFLHEARSFNQPLDLANVTSIGDYFLYNCYSFNQPLDLSNITNIEHYFLSGATLFNQPLDLSNITSIGSNFLNNCYSFNQPLDLSNITNIENYFLNGARSFNQPLDLANVTSIGYYFLGSTTSFNQPLNLPNVTSIGDSFLRNARSFNQPLDLSNVTTIRERFLQDCYSFNQPLIITNTTQSIGTYFLFNCYSLSAITWNSDKYPTDIYSLSQEIDSKTVFSNGEGIKVYGTHKIGLFNALPNSWTKPYRRLTGGGS